MSLSSIWSPLFRIALLGITVVVVPQVGIGAGHETLTPGEATQVGMLSQWQLPLSVSGGADSIVDGKIHIDRSRVRVLYEVVADGKVLVRVPADTLDVDNETAEILAAAASGPAATESDTAPKSPNATARKRREYDFVIGADGSRQARIKGTGEVVWVEEKGGMRFPLRAAGNGDVPAAEKEADRLAKMETYKLKRLGILATVNRREVPQVRLYVLGADGTLEARDAETGRLMWVGMYGNSQLPTKGLSVTNDIVAFTNGKTLFVVNSMNGKVVTEYRLDSVPITSPTIIGEYVMTACSNRKIEGYSLKDIGGERFTAMAAGLPSARATRAPGAQRMMWPTEAGFVYAIDGIGKPSLEFRFPANGLVSAKLAASTGERFYMATDKGQVYGVSAEKTGRLLWRQSLGEPVYSSPVLVGERVLVSTVYGRLYCLDANNGSMIWPAPVTQVSKVLGGTKSQVFVRTSTEHLEAIDIESGSVAVEFFATNIIDAIENPYTDRLYLLTKSGTVQCLRPATSELPEMMLPDAPTSAVGEEAGAGAGNKQDGAADDQPEKDPFGAGGNMGNDAGGADPFGGSDPFGGGAGGNDPFGGGADDPFGGF